MSHHTLSLSLPLSFPHQILQMREVGEAFEAMVQCGAIPHHRPTVPSHTTPNTSTIFSSSHPTVSSSPTPNRIHWLQLLMYDFGLGGPLPKSNRWNNLAMDNTGISGNRQFMDRGSRLLWRTTLPLNHVSIVRIFLYKSFFRIVPGTCGAPCSCSKCSFATSTNANNSWSDIGSDSFCADNTPIWWWSTTFFRHRRPSLTNLD